MKFDASRAWKEASEAVTANREVLFAIAGVFILLPTLAFSMLFPQPQPPAGLQGEAAMQFALDYYGSIAPWVIGMGVVEEVVRAFVSTDFEGARHAQRVVKIDRT